VTFAAANKWTCYDGSVATGGAITRESPGDITTVADFSSLTYATTSATTSPFNAQVRFSRPFIGNGASDINIVDGSTLNLNVFYTVLATPTSAITTTRVANDQNDYNQAVSAALIAVVN
jgi:hypothetical protein